MIFTFSLLIVNSTNKDIFIEMGDNMGTTQARYSNYFILKTITIAKDNFLCDYFEDSSFDLERYNREKALLLIGHEYLHYLIDSNLPTFNIYSKQITNKNYYTLITELNNSNHNAFFDSEKVGVTQCSECAYSTQSQALEENYVRFLTYCMMEKKMYNSTQQSCQDQVFNNEPIMISYIEPTLTFLKSIQVQRFILGICNQK